MSSGNQIAAIVLAAGQSSRLGRPKQLLPVDGQPMLSRTLDVARRSRLSPRILVLGAGEVDVLQSINTEGFEIVNNPRYAEGQATSLQAGLDGVPEDAAGAVILLGDQALVPPHLIDQLVDRFDPAPHIAVRPRYRDGPGNPVLLSREIFPALQKLEGDVGARDVLARNRDRIAEVDATDRPTPIDVDTEEDYLRFLQDWASLGAPEVPRYCQRCGSAVALTRRYDRLRPICPACDFTYLFDPKVAVAVIIEIDGKIVMQRREIDPGAGKWTFPSGFVDRGEVVRQAAAREVHEEVGLHLDRLDLMAIYSAPGETVTLIVFTASLTGQTPHAGHETTETGLFPPDALPTLAFPRDARIIKDWRTRRDGN